MYAADFRALGPRGQRLRPAPPRRALGSRKAPSSAGCRARPARAAIPAAPAEGSGEARVCSSRVRRAPPSTPPPSRIPPPALSTANEELRFVQKLRPFALTPPRRPASAAGVWWVPSSSGGLILKRIRYILFEVLHNLRANLLSGGYFEFYFFIFSKEKQFFSPRIFSWTQFTYL